MKSKTFQMSFNGAEHPENFIGDFHYQEPRKEQVTSSILTDRVQWMLNLFTKHRKLPENIIILRDGVSDGQFKMVSLNFKKALCNYFRS